MRLEGAAKSIKSNQIEFFALENNWTLYYYSKIHCRLEQEIDQVVGVRSEITYSDLSSFEYIGMVFKETMRLWPPAGQIHRKLTKELVVDGIAIPEGTTVSAPIFLAGRNPKYFKNPLEFRPERWSKTESIVAWVLLQS